MFTFRKTIKCATDSPDYRLICTPKCSVISTRPRLQYQQINLRFTDTDSLLYEVFTNDIYADMYENKEEYDFSEYPFIHPNYDKTNKNVIGKFKDELNGLPLEEFVGLRAKCYSLRYQGKVENNIVEHEIASEMQKAKGAKRV